METTPNFGVDCPFCGARVVVSEQAGTVLHSIPTCPEYDAAEDSLAFVEKCNEELRKRTQV